MEECYSLQSIVHYNFTGKAILEECNKVENIGSPKNKYMNFGNPFITNKNSI